MNIAEPHLLYIKKNQHGVFEHKILKQCLFFPEQNQSDVSVCVKNRKTALYFCTEEAQGGGHYGQKTPMENKLASMCGKLTLHTNPECEMRWWQRDAFVFLKRSGRW